MREYSDFIDMLKEFMLSLNEPEYFDISLDLLILSKLVEVTNDPKKWWRKNLDGDRYGKERCFRRV